MVIEKGQFVKGTAPLFFELLETVGGAYRKSSIFAHK